MPINLEQVEAKSEAQRARDQAEHMAAEIALGTALGCIKSLHQMGRHGAIKFIASAAIGAAGMTKPE